MASISPGFEGSIDLVRLINGVDRFLDIPEMLNRHIVSNAAELALDANATGIVRAGLDRVDGRSTLWLSVVMVVTEVSSAVIVPPGCGVYQPRRIKLPHDICQAELGIVWIYNLTPAFVVDDLHERSANWFYWKSRFCD